MTIRSLDASCGSAHETLGGKAQGLGFLLAHGFSVPDGFVVPVDAYAEHATRVALLERIGGLLAAESWEEAASVAKAAILGSALQVGLRTEIVRAWEAMGSPLVSVRSSAIAEDGEGASFAGQHDTILDVSESSVLVESILRCWVSLWSRRALRYRSAHGIAIEPAGMGVVVQRMVHADAAGVVFTVDPLSHHRDRMLLEVAAGGGEAVVSGRIRGEVCILDRRRKHPKPSGHRPRCITAAQLRELAETALRIEVAAGSPQDIEFAFAEGNLHLLQTRPVTAPGESLPPLPATGFVDRMVAAIARERYPVAPRPLDNEVFVRMVGAAMHVGRHFGLAFDTRDEERFRNQFWHQGYRLPRCRPTLRSFLQPLRLLGLLRVDWVHWWNRGPGPELRRIGAQVDPRSLDDAFLLARMDSILRDWVEPTNQRFLAASAIDAETWLRWLVIVAVGRRSANRTMGMLLSGISTPTSRTNAALWELSRIALRDSVVREVLREGRWHAIPGGSEFDRAFRLFLDEFGHRESCGFYLSAPTWRRDPDPVLKIIRTLLEAKSPPPDDAKSWREARRRVERGLPCVPGLRKSFRYLLGRMRALHRFREISHFDLSRPLDALQAVAQEAGRRLQSRGMLDTMYEVYLLRLEEVRSWLSNGTGRCGDVRQLLSKRRRIHRLVDARWRNDRSDRRAGEALRGLGASPGQARGRVRIVLDEGDFGTFVPGEILVCDYSNPSWTPLFLVAAAVVTETGGPASHAAIVAREYGMPAVLAVSGATRILRNGQDVQVDGDTGIVEILPMILSPS